MTLPWEADTDLSLDAVSRALAAVDARFRDSSIVALLGGWDFHTFLVDDDWIFRFPKRDSVTEALRAEWRVLDAVRPLGLRYDVPNHVFRVEPSASFHRPFCGYPLCPGTPLIEAPVVALSDLDEFLDFIDRIGSIQVEAPREDRSITPWIEESLERLADLHGALEPAVVEGARGLLTVRPAASDVTVFLHNDLGPEHILVDEGRVTSVIDWADGAYGDPAADVAGAVLAFGYWPVRGALTRDDAFWDRVRIRVTLAAISSIWFGVRQTRADHVRAGRRALESIC